MSLQLNSIIVSIQGLSETPTARHVKLSIKLRRKKKDLFSMLILCFIQRRDQTLGFECGNSFGQKSYCGLWDTLFCL